MRILYKEDMHGSLFKNIKSYYRKIFLKTKIFRLKFKV